MEDHTIAVAVIAERVKSFYDRNIPFRVYHGATNSTRPSNRDPDRIIDTSLLANVISIDKTTQTAVVEPNVPMDQLVATTLAEGFVPLVVPEFPGITVGGSFSGTAAESSSFKYGYFDRSVNWIEIVLANGEIVKASPQENADLYNGAIGACGTLGVTTLFELQLQPSAEFVELTYVPVHSVTEALALIAESTEGQWDYVDGILYSKTSGVIVLGRLANEKKYPVVHFTRAHDPWFYLHAHEKVKHHCDTCGNVPTWTELVPVEDYFFRYDRGSFWMGSYGWPPGCFNRVGRYLLDSALRTRVMYKAMHHSGRSQQFIIQDLAIPVENANDFLEYLNDDMEIYPLWLCPVRADTKASLHLANRPDKTAYIMNIGVWGISSGLKHLFETGQQSQLVDKAIEDNRAIEAKVKELGGLKWLYAHCYYREDEFWRIYDKAAYDKLREKWSATTLPSIWDKVKRTEERRAGSFLGAIVYTLLGKDHLLKK